MRIYLAVSTFLITLFTFLPLIPTGNRWIRLLDYPVLQLAAWTLVNLVLVSVGFGLERNHQAILGFLLAASLLLQAQSVFPYLPFTREQVKKAGADRNRDNDITLLIFNVLMTNRESGALRTLVRRTEPDILLITEPDSWWEKELQELKGDYPHHVLVPKENTYGMMLFSRLPLSEKRVLTLIKEDIPSIRAVIELRSGAKVELFGVHPRPPTEDDTDYRDAELLLAARKMKGSHYPGIVAGDLNDVAWSRTTRLFQKESRMLDPRAGRGFYNTFHAKIPFLRYPLDHVFIEKDFALVDLKRLPSPGSDHFPILIRLSLNPKEAKAQEPLPKDKGDAEEVEDILGKAGKS